eukprot:scaffold294967_cov17-Tisochrysis_lutea.AAC.1
MPRQTKSWALALPPLNSAAPPAPTPCTMHGVRHKVANVPHLECLVLLARKRQTLMGEGSAGLESHLGLHLAAAAAAAPQL